MTNRSNSKKIFFVGAGPGRPDLITRAGWKTLNRAEIILYDALLDFEGFKKAAPNAKWINVGKRARKVSIKQKFIGKLLVNYFLQGFSVLRLKGGDPSVFGRISEEVEVLTKENIPYEIIPGVTAASSAAADLGVSLSKRDESRSISFVTPAMGLNTSNNHKWLDTVFNSDTSIIYMAGKDRKKIAKILISNGMNPLTPIAIVENAGLNEGYKTITSLNSLSIDEVFELNGPVCLIVGKVLLDSHFIYKQNSLNINLQFINHNEKIKKICHGK